jgi:tetratricopeptide (TPR) repeat protein
VIRPLAISLAFLLVCIAPAALAQSDANRAAAQTLFDAAQELKKDGDFEQACDKFQKSQKLDPAIGTQLNLADCWEQLGKTASAWVNYIEVSQRSEAGERRAKFARERADAIKPKLIYLRLEVAQAVKGLVITRNGIDIPEASWGAAVPVDPGEYELLAKAPGKLPWRDDVELNDEGEEFEVRVPAMANAALNSDEDFSPDEPDGGATDEAGNGQLIAGVVVGAVGIVGIGIGAAFAGIAHSTAAESEDNCLPNDPNQCDAEGVSLREDAQSAQTVYVLSLALGGAATVVGLILILTAPDGDSAGDAHVELAPHVGPTFNGLSLRGRF